MVSSSLPSFLARLSRPFTTSTQLGITQNGSGIPASATTKTQPPPGTELLTVAAGCFWGVEHAYRRHWPVTDPATGKPLGLLDARVGYTGGHASAASPSYRQVCTDTTGHAEALQIAFDPSVVSYRALLELFYRVHDPTTAGRQGGDVGGQYRSAVFYHGPEQERVAHEVTRLAGEQWWGGAAKVVTEVVPATTWWDAEEYHQLYLERNPAGYQCPTHFLRKFPDLK